MEFKYKDVLNFCNDLIYMYENLTTQNYFDFVDKYNDNFINEILLPQTKLYLSNISEFSIVKYGLNNEYKVKIFFEESTNKNTNENTTSPIFFKFTNFYFIFKHICEVILEKKQFFYEITKHGYINGVKSKDFQYSGKTIFDFDINQIKRFVYMLEKSREFFDIDFIKMYLKYNSDNQNKIIVYDEQNNYEKIQQNISPFTIIKESDQKYTIIQICSVFKNQNTYKINFIKIYLNKEEYNGIYISRSFFSFDDNDLKINRLTQIQKKAVEIIFPEKFI